MKIRIISKVILCTLFFGQQSFAVFRFSHRNATVSVGNARFVINNALTNWNGTLEQKGSVVGRTISFNEGVLNRNNTPAFATCTYDGDATRQITLSTSQLLRVDHGQFLPRLDIIRSGNRLEGAPIFTNTSSINLAHHLSSLTIAVNGKLNSDILMNRGSIILDDDLHLGDDRNFTGSGQVFLNNKRLSFGGSNMAMTHTIDFVDATDITLNSDVFLSGIWTFTGAGLEKEAHIVGNGNLLDLSSGGTIWVKAGTKVHFTDIKIKGLGTGFFVFEDRGSQIRFSDVQLEMSRNYTVTQGGIYVNGDTTIVTKNRTLTFANNSTLTVDGVTLWYDTTISPNTFNIQPSVGSANYSNVPNGKNIATINDGRIAAVTTDDCCRANSNAIIYLNRTTSNSIVNIDKRVTNNSNAIVSLDRCCRVNSNAIVTHDKEIVNNSNAIVSLTKCCLNNSNAIVNIQQQVINNSNAIVNIVNNNNNELVIQNSKAIVSLDRCCRVNSNAIVTHDKEITNNSNAIVSLKDCCINNSQRITNNSNAIISLKECCESNSECCRHNSNAIVTHDKEITNNSNAIISLDRCCRVNSNAIVTHDKEITNNSNAIVSLDRCCRVNSNAIVTHDKEITNNSNAIVTHDKEITNNSNAIVSLKDCCINNSQRITNNSNAIISLKECCESNSECCRVNSNAIVTHDQEIVNNSNAIVSLAECCRTNSNALISGIKNNSNAIISLAECCENNSNAIVYLSHLVISVSNSIQTIINNSTFFLNIINNSATLSGLVIHSSNAIVSLAECCRHNSNAIVYGLKNDSNAILSLKDCCRVNSNAIVTHDKEIENNSNAIVSLSECCRHNSNAIVQNDKEIVNNSNAIVSLDRCCRVNSNAIVTHDEEIVNNSNAIVSLSRCCVNNSNAIVTNDKEITNNSNAIVSLDRCCRTNSNAIVTHDKEIVNNSNAIVSLSRCCVNNSNAIINIDNRVTNNSNAIINIDNRVTNNSNAIISLSRCCVNNSNAIISLKECCINNSQRITNNSNAIIVLAECCKNNSNAIVSIKPSCCPLTKAPLVADVLMECNCIVDPVQQIRISANLTIDGQGAWIMFSDPEGPEFIIDPGVTVRLKDVSLLRLTSNTFQFGEGSKLEIEGIVDFELTDDLFFTNENVEIVGTTDNPSLLLIRGMGSQRNLFFEPIIVDGSILKTWNLNFNSLVLQNVELLGVESIQTTEVPIGDEILAGTVTLGGEAAVNINQDTDVSFAVEDNNNRMILLQNNLTLNKFILYSPFLDSELHLKFQLPTLIVGNPLVNFADDLLLLTGVDGQARLFFDDYWAQVFNVGINSFGTDDRAFISGRNVEIQNFPIKQNSSDLILDSTLLMHTAPGDLANAIETAFIKSPQLARVPGMRASGKRVTTAFNMIREKLKTNVKQKAAHNLARLKQRPKIKPLVIGKPKHGKKRDGFEIIDDVDEATRAKLSTIAPRLMMHRAITLPTDAEVTLKITGPAVDANQLAGTVIVSDGSVTNFGVSQTENLNLFMLGGATLVQGEPEPTKVAMRMTRALNPADFVSLSNPADTTNVDGLANNIVVKKDSKVEGTIALDPDAQCTVQFDDKNFGPELLFNPVQGLDGFDIATNARFEFKGKGTTWFGEDFKFNLVAATDTGSGQRTTLAFSDGVKAKFKRQLVEDKLLGGMKAVSEPFSSLTVTSSINGIGAVKIDTGAQMLVEKGQRLEFGGDDGNVAITIDRFGVLSVDASAQTIDALIKAPCSSGATISMHSATYSIDVNEGAILNIGCDACFGINWNANQDIEGRGTLTSFKIKNRAVLNVEKGGRLIIGRNSEPVPAGLAGFGSQFLFDPFGGIITGQGIVALGKSGFAGRIQSNNARPEYVVAQQFVRSLINIVPSLKFATVFIDETGKKKLFNSGIFVDGLSVTLVNNNVNNITPNPNNALIDPGKERQFITLQAGDEVCGDDPDTGIVFGFNNGSRFTILPNGKRLNS